MMVVHFEIFLFQNNLLSMLISQTDIRQSDLSSSILEALQGDEEKYKAINE